MEIPNEENVLNGKDKVPSTSKTHNIASTNTSQSSKYAEESSTNYLLNKLSSEEMQSISTKIVQEGIFFKFININPVEITGNKTLIDVFQNLRVIQNELVYIIGLSPKIADKSVLNKFEYCGQYGKILKIVVNNSKTYNPKGGQGPSYSAYITYSSQKEASIAILSLDQCYVDDRIIRASFGTTKYCIYFLRNQKCTNKECLYLHEFKLNYYAVSKEEVNNKELFSDLQKTAYNISGIKNLTKEEFLLNMKKSKNKVKSIFPAPSIIYEKSFGFGSNIIVNEKKIAKNNIIEAPKDPEIIKEAINTKESKKIEEVNNSQPTKSKFGFYLQEKISNPEEKLEIPIEIHNIVENILSSSPLNEEKINNNLLDHLKINLEFSPNNKSIQIDKDKNIKEITKMKISKLQFQCPNPFLSIFGENTQSDNSIPKSKRVTFTPREINNDATIINKEEPSTQFVEFDRRINNINFTSINDKAIESKAKEKFDFIDKKSD